jgi:Xaa-Pro dipeptidase
MIGRRGFLGGAIALGAVLAVPDLAAAAAPPLIAAAERLQRIAKAQRLMRQAGLRALLVEPGSSLTYFTGVEWWRSERLTAAVIPAEGEPLIVTPAFEEPSVRESLGIVADVRTWHEHEDPAAVIADWLKVRSAAGPLGVEETVRFFAVDALRRLGVETRGDAGVVRACRVIKSPAEIALMQRATDITIAAYREVGAMIRPGLPAAEIEAAMLKAMTARGGTSPWALILPNEASAYPHGTKAPQTTRAGGILLMDCGCGFEGYQSDVSRTMVLGEPTKTQRAVWEQVRRGQQIAFETARVGTPAGAVDDAVRAAYERAGYGPGYALPGLSHRTGHGIGMDGHEPVNLVRGETTPLAPGMCFSNEPGIYIPGGFGVRLEDCIHMTEAGPQWFSTPPASIDAPFA